MQNPADYQKTLDQSIDFLRLKKKILFLTTSNRWSGEQGGEKPKSTLLAEHMANEIGLEKVKIIDVPRLNIYPCEGNVSTRSGNTCGLQKAMLDDPTKNPSGHHRCWASVNNPDDELWKISRELFKSDTVVFFTSVRWGQTNAYYQKLIERLTWIENRHSTLGESNIVKDIDAGIIVIGQNWNGTSVLETQKSVLEYFGFQVREELSWNWQYTKSAEDENNQTYLDAARAFDQTFLDTEKISS